MSAGVGLLAYGLDRSPGGIGRYTRELRNGLARCGVDVTLVHAGRAPAGSDGISLRGAGRLPALLTIGQVQLARAVGQHRLGLVHDPTGTAPLALTRARRVVTIHDAIPYVRPETSTALDKLIYRGWLPLIARRVDAIITVTEHARAELVRHLSLSPERVETVAHGVGAEFRPLPPREVAPVLARHGIGWPYILYVGSIEARKNLVRLLEAFATLLPEVPDWKLVVVGARKWKFGPTFETVGRLRLGDAVHFTGYVADADLPALYSGARLFAFPSLHEGFGLPVLEAMACATPVVTANASSLPEVAGDAALLVDPLDVGALSHAMARLIRDQDLGADLRRRGLARAQLFSWARTADATARIYERLLDRPLRTSAALVDGV